MKDNGIPCVSYGEIHSKFGRIIDPDKHQLKFADEGFLESNPNSLLSRGDFLFADTSEDLEGSGNFTCLDSDSPTFAGYHTVIARLLNRQEFDYKYLSYFFDSIEFRNQIRSSVTGIKVFSITQGILKSTSIVVPKLQEQSSISSYLDRKTAEIDELINDKKRLIELYEEEKTSVVNQAVTKGLDPNAPMKDSGIEWLGKIPKHWEVKRLRYLGSTLNGLSKSADFFGRGYPFISYSDVYKNEFLPSNFSGLVESTEVERDNLSVKEGDVFFTRTSETIEEIGIASTCTKTIPNAVFAGFLIRFRPISNRLTTNFSKYYFRAQIHRRYFVKEMNLVTRASLSQELLKKLPILLPPISEQFEIAKHLEFEIRAINGKILKTKKLIDLLTEYRTALISEVVTGKTKVID